MKLWIVGKINECDCKQSWATNGVFDSEEKAIKACITDDYFIMPVTLNEHLGDEEIRQAVGCYYPRLETQEEADQRCR